VPDAVDVIGFLGTGRMGMPMCANLVRAGHVVRTRAQAHELGVPFELSDLVERIHLRALSRYGPVGGELLAVALLEEEAGTLLRVDGAVTGRTDENGLPSV